MQDSKPNPYKSPSAPAAVDGKPGTRVFARLPIVAVITAVCLGGIWLGMRDHYYPEGNWLPGPLWLLKTGSRIDHLIGTVVALGLLPLICAAGVWPNAATIAMSILGLVAWVAFGAWLAAMAVV